MQQCVIAGGGSAGWMAAALLAKVMGHAVRICLVESEEIGTVGVGEATIPPILAFNQVLGITEREFIQATGGSFKLGIQFEHWGKLGDSYMHAFGEIGAPLSLLSFHHYWLRAKAAGHASDFWDFSLAYQAAKAGKFANKVNLTGTPFSQFPYAYHFDASRYALLLRQKAEALGVQRIEGKIARVEQAQNGDIHALHLADGQCIVGDFFIDCTGFQALLIEQTLQSGYDDWRHWLPCDRALAVPTKAVTSPIPFTRAIAHQAGWQWRIPLQHRTGNGLVYCSRYLNDADARDLLISQLDGEMLAEPRLIQFTTGRRRLQWSHNCLALGLASGFLEPLESTSLHLIQSGLLRLIRFFPASADYADLRAEYNRQSQQEFEQVRDFIILHYHQTARDDSDFWRSCRTMPIPATLSRKLAVFRQQGVVQREPDDVFTELAWQQVLLGQGITPVHCHPLTAKLSAAQLDELLANLQQIVQGIVHHLPSHHTSLQQLMSDTR